MITVSHGVGARSRAGAVLAASKRVNSFRSWATQ
jgi:hypothetical protein